MLNQVKTLQQSSIAQTIASKFLPKKPKYTNTKSSSRFSPQVLGNNNSHPAGVNLDEKPSEINLKVSENNNIIETKSILDDGYLSPRDKAVLTFLQNKINHYINQGSVLRFIDFEEEYKAAINKKSCDMLIQLELFWQKIKNHYHDSEQSVTFYHDLISFYNHFNHSYAKNSDNNNSNNNLIISNNQLIFFKLQSKTHQNSFIEIDGEQIPLPQDNNKIINKILYLLNLMSFFKVVKMTCDYLETNLSVTLLNIKYITNEEA